jgi:tetratricopeptide (TPR) repeat protein
MDEGPKDPSKPADPAQPRGSDAALPRGASPAELDHLRAVVKVSTRPLTTPPRVNTVRRSTPSPLPPTQAAANQAQRSAEVSRTIDEGRALLDADPKAAHAVFEKAYRRNINDVRVLSNYGLTLVLVEGDRQRGIRFCEEAVRRGPVSTETLVNLAKALVQTRNKEQAVRALRRAMELAPNDPRVGSEFLALGLRRPPPIRWLPRNFFLNRWLGKLSWRLSKKRFDPTQSWGDQPEAAPQPESDAQAVAPR